MKKFAARETRQAIEYAAGGGQALHCHRVIADISRAPLCFRRAVARGEDIAHLFDADRDRLEATARRLGVRVIVVERCGNAAQHIDLCGAPLRKAIQECDREE